MFTNFIVLLIPILSYITVLRNIKITKINLKDFLMIYTITLGLVYIANMINPTVTIPIIITVLLGYQILVKKENCIKVFIASFLSVILTLACDFFMGYFFINVLKVSFDGIKNNILITLLISMGVFACSFVTSFLVGRIVSKNSGVFKENNNSKKFITILSINIAAAFFVVYLFTFFINNHELTNSMILGMTIIATVYFVSSFVAIIFYGMYIKKDIELVQKKSETKQLQEYTDMIEYLYSDMRKFKHDYINLLSTINGYIQMEEIEELKKYFSEKIIPMSNQVGKDDIRLSSLYNLKNIPLKGLISSKLLQAQNRKMDVLIDIAENVDIKEESIAIIDICRMMGILIDNAIDAAYESEEKFVRIALVNRGNSIILLVLNSVKGDIPQIHKMFKKGFSTKGDNRGLGLSNVNEIIRSYDNITINTFIEKSIFTQEITITT